MGGSIAKGVNWLPLSDGLVFYQQNVARRRLVVDFYERRTLWPDLEMALIREQVDVEAVAAALAARSLS